MFERGRAWCCVFRWREKAKKRKTRDIYGRKKKKGKSLAYSMTSWKMPTKGDLHRGTFRRYSLIVASQPSTIADSCGTAKCNFVPCTFSSSRHNYLSNNYAFHKARMGIPSTVYMPSNYKTPNSRLNAFRSRSP